MLQERCFHALRIVPRTGGDREAVTADVRVLSLVDLRVMDLREWRRFIQNSIQAPSRGIHGISTCRHWHWTTHSLILHLLLLLLLTVIVSIPRKVLCYFRAEYLSRLENLCGIKGDLTAQWHCNRCQATT